MSRTQSAQRGRMNKVIATMSAVLLCLAGAANAGEAKAHSRSSSLASTTNTVLFGVDAEAALPLSTYSDINGFGGGALLPAGYPLKEERGLSGPIGFDFP